MSDSLNPNPNPEPSPATPNGDRLKTDGRNPDGTFAKGNAGGPGNPNAADVARHRARFYQALRDSDVDRALKTIRSVMKRGKDAERLAAAREMLDRIIGKAIGQDLAERMDALEKALAALTAKSKEASHG